MAAFFFLRIDLDAPPIIQGCCSLRPPAKATMQRVASLVF
jgi:hypothetical protein